MNNNNINNETATVSTQHTNVAEEYNIMSDTFVSSFRIATEMRKRRGTTMYTRVLTCDSTLESGNRWYYLIICKDIYEISCRLADIGSSEENNYAQVKIMMADDYSYTFNFRYNHNAKAFYEELFDEVFLE
jgi:hypothetical protein